MKDVGDIFSEFGTEEGAALIKAAIRPFTPRAEPSRQSSVGTNLPDIIPFRQLKGSKPPKPPEVIKGLLHKGSKMVLGGGSKSYKTWSLADMALSVASGKAWWEFEVIRGRVLYIDLEIQPGFFSDRLERIAGSKGITDDADVNLDVLSLRGHAADFSELLPKVEEKMRGTDYSLIILDPIYKGLAGKDENSAGDIGALLNEIEKLTVNTGAAVVFGAHFSKGNQAGKESIDRIAGSGVFARDPDTILVMTRHEESDCYTVEATLRNFAPVPSFCLRWVHPIMMRDKTLDPDRLKQSKNKEQKYHAHHLLAALGNDELAPGEWQKRTMENTGMGATTFASLRRELSGEKKIEKVNEKYRKKAEPEKVKAAGEPKPTPPFNIPPPIIEEPLCLSEKDDSISMWGHYCEKHAGFVLGFDRSWKWFEKLRKVTYGTVRPVWDTALKPGSAEDLCQLEKIILTKNVEWQYEHEVRQLFMLETLICQNGGYFLPIPPEVITSICIGLRASTEDRSELRSILDAPQLSHVTIREAQLHQAEFKIETGKAQEA